MGPCFPERGCCGTEALNSMDLFDSDRLGLHAAIQPSLAFRFGETIDTVVILAKSLAGLESGSPAGRCLTCSPNPSPFGPSCLLHKSLHRFDA